MSTGLNHILPANIFRLIFDKSPGSILVSANKLSFTILAVSDSYLKITSTTRDKILNKGFFEVFPDDEVHPNDHTAARNVFEKVIETGQKIDIPRYRYDVYDAGTKTHQPHYWSCSNVPIMAEDGTIAYILNTVVDITEEVKARETAIESENTLRLATEATGLGLWDLDLKTHHFNYSPRLAEIFGYSPDAKLSLGQIRSGISDDDMENIVKKSFRAGLVTGEHNYEVKTICADGSQRWVKAQGIIIFDKDKQPVRMLGTILDITESKRDEIRKNDFIAMASHELKTPLTSLKAYIQLVSKKLKNTDDAFVNNALLKAHNQANKMSDLIYGFLDLSRLESGKLQLKTEVFDINKFIEDTIAETVQVNTSHNFVFKPSGVINVLADKEKIGQVMSNFFSNAIKYSPKESTITVTSAIDNGIVTVAVIDEGVGIKLKDQEKLFQRFYRVENEKLKNVSGFGIGLYLAGEIIQRHKGSIGVNSIEDKGSTFYFSLPCIA
jgi:two-component system sensor histidine kinase VicK